MLWYAISVTGVVDDRADAFGRLGYDTDTPEPEVAKRCGRAKHTHSCRTLPYFIRRAWLDNRLERAV